MITGKTKIKPKNIFGGLFSGDFFKKKSIISEEDIQALENYNTLLADNTPAEALEQSMNGASKTAQNLAKSAKGAAVDINTIPKVSKAATVGIKLLSTAMNIGATLAITALISGITKMIGASEEMSQQASEATSKYKEQTASIDEYKNKITELKTALNDENISYSDARDKRSQLLDIQKQLIDTYGAEASGVNLVNGSLDDEMKKMDALNKQNRQEWENEVNKLTTGQSWQKWGGAIGLGLIDLIQATNPFAYITGEHGFGFDYAKDWLSDFDNKTNIERIQEKVENFKESINLNDLDIDNESLKNLKEQLDSFQGVSFKGNKMTIAGDAKTVQDTITQIQTQVIGSREDLRSLDQDLKDVYNSAKKIVDANWDTYNTALQNQILDDKTGLEYYGKLTEVYETYQEAVKDGDEKTVNEAKEGYAKILSDIAGSDMSDSFKKFFENMYPDISDIVDDWKFEVDIVPKINTNKDGLRDDIETVKGLTTEEISAAFQNNGTGVSKDQWKAITDLNAEAQANGLDLTTFLELLKEDGYLVSQLDKDIEKAVNNAKNKYGDGVDWNKYFKDNSIDTQEEIDKWNEVTNGIDNAEDAMNAYAEATKKANEMTVSLDKYKSASDSISSLATAFKELTDNEYISLETISKIKEAVGDSISNWDEYEQKLLSVKEGTAEYNQLMSELTYATLEKQLGGVNALAQTDEKYVTQLLKENGVLNANEVAHDAVERAKAKELIQSELAKDVSEINIGSLLDEASTCDITTDAYVSLVAQEIVFNSNNLNTSQKITALQQLAQQAGLTGAKYQALSALLNTPYEADSQTQEDWAKKHGFTIERKSTTTKNSKGETVEDWLWWKDGVSYENVNEAALSLANSYFNDALKTETLTVPIYSGNSPSKDTKETFNWLETAISRLQRSITNFGKTVSATWKSWTERNSALKSQISEVTKEIDLQQQAADKYWNLAESVTGVGNYKELIQKGSLDISTVTNEDDINAIKQYQEYYEAYLAALDAKQDAEDELANLVREDFNMIAKQFDSEISLVEANMGIIEAYINQAEMKGNLVSKNYYSAMSAEEEKNLSLLQQKYDKLTSKLSNGEITKGSEEWNSMSVEIKEVNKAIIESNTKLEEYQKTMRELDWEAFDLIQDKIGNVTEESEFLIDLLSKSKLFNEDGSITSQGQATLGLHVANMKIYESQVKDYADEIARLDEEFASDPLDQNYLERREELVELQKDAILNCQNEKDSMKDLMSEGYDNLLSYMDKLISKRKDLLSQASDARSFQKTVKEQTDEIARLQNIIGSYGGSLSEEDRAIVQKHQVSLESAQEDLEDTLYDQYISDTEKMLDLLVEDTEGIISTRLDDTDGLIDDVVQKTEENTDAIKETLVSEVSNVGGTISTAMNTLWSDNISGVVGGVSTTLTEIKELVGKMVKGSDTEASQNTSDATSDVTPNVIPVSNPQPTSTPTQQSTEKEITVGGLINASGALIYSNANGGGGSRQYYRANPIYTVLSERNGFLKVRHQSLSSGTTGWFKKSDVKAYKTGGLVDYTGLAWVDGQKGRPEAFLNANDTELFAKLRDSLAIVSKTNMFDAIQSYTKMPNFVTNGGMNNHENMIFNGDIILPDVQTPEDFARKMKEVYDKNTGNVRTMYLTDAHSKYGSMNYRRYL